MSKSVILALGYIPKQYGGRQTSGLATGCFELFDSINSLNEDFIFQIAATDLHHGRKIKSTYVHGWKKYELIFFSILNPIHSILTIIEILKHYRFWKLFNPFKLFFKILYLEKLNKSVNPTYCHVDGSLGALIAIVSKKIPLNKTILRIHGINGQDNNIKDYLLHRKLEEYISRFKFFKVSFVSREISLDWCEMYKCFDNHRIIYNSYDCYKFFPERRETIYDLVTFSQISPRKGQIRVLEALARLKKEKSIELKYLIIGDGADKNRLKNFAKTYNLNVEILPYLNQDEINVFLNKSLYFILPTSSEGFGKVFIESIGAGLKVISPKLIPIAKEGILNNKNAFFTEDHNVDSIYLELEKIFTIKKKYNHNDVSESIHYLKPKTIGRKYLNFILND